MNASDSHPSSKNLFAIRFAHLSLFITGFSVLILLSSLGVANEHSDLNYSAGLSGLVSSAIVLVLETNEVRQGHKKHTRRVNSTPKELRGKLNKARTMLSSRRFSSSGLSDGMSMGGML